MTEIIYPVDSSPQMTEYPVMDTAAFEEKVNSSVLLSYVPMIKSVIDPVELFRQAMQNPNHRKVLEALISNEITRIYKDISSSDLTETRSEQEIITSRLQNIVISVRSYVDINSKMRICASDPIPVLYYTDESDYNKNAVFEMNYQPWKDPSTLMLSYRFSTIPSQYSCDETQSNVTLSVSYHPRNNNIICAYHQYRLSYIKQQIM